MSYPTWSRTNALGLISLFALTILTVALTLISGRMALGAEPEQATQRIANPNDHGQLVPTSTQAIITDPSSCRIGVDARGADQVAWVDDVGAGWFVLFGGFADSASNDAEHVPVISVLQKKDAEGNYLNGFDITPPLTDEELGALVDFNPGTLWIVGNEVDRGPSPGETGRVQGDTYPDIYAEAYHAVYQFIKGRDPTAQVAIAGLVEVTPGRLQYLDLVWQAYLQKYKTFMPVDVWTMHIYIMPEVNIQGQPNGIAGVALGTDLSLAIRESGGNPALCPLNEVYCLAEHDSMANFEQQVRAMRSWMANHGQREKPLLLTEYSILYPYEIDPGGTCFITDEYGACFTPSRILTFMQATLAYLKSAADPSIGNPLDANRLVQQWAWFSINNDPGVGNVSDLVDKDPGTGNLTGLTQLGTAFASLSAAESLYVNLVPGQLAYPVIKSAQPPNQTIVSLWLDVANNGSLSLVEPFEVAFYADAGLNDKIGTILVDPATQPDGALAGCVRREIRINVEWTGLGPGLHRYWVKVDSSGVIAEGAPDIPGETDNVGTGFVLVDPEQSYYPIISRH